MGYSGIKGWFRNPWDSIGNAQDIYWNSQEPHSNLHTWIDMLTTYVEIRWNTINHHPMQSNIGYRKGTHHLLESIEG